MVGGFTGDADFDPGPATFTLTASSLGDGFVAKLTTNGNFVWVKQIRNTTNDYYQFMQSRAIEIDGMNNIITTGDFSGTMDFDPGVAVKSTASNGVWDCYILKLTDQGEFIWVKTIGGVEIDGGNDVVVDKANNVYVVGGFGTSVDFDPGPGDSTINTPYYGAPALIKLTAQGNFVYAAAFPSISYGSGLFRRMDIDTSLNIYVTGFLSGTLDFDPSPNEYPLTGSTDESPFVLKLGPCANSTTSTLYLSACGSVTVNNERFDSSGTYTQTIRNTAGCDSIITLHLTISKELSQQTKVICEGEYFFAGGANQTLSGTYIDTLQTVQGCDSIVTTYLTVNPKPLPNLGPDRDLCSNSELNVSPGTFDTYLWQDMSIADSFRISAPGSYRVRVTNSYGCAASDTLRVSALLPVPSGFLKASDSLCTYETLNLAAAGTYLKYQWSTGAAERSVQLRQPGTYWLTVTDANGCEGTESITVFAKQCRAGFYIPTAFTPNGDGRNDLFRPLLYGNVKKYRFAVYNRWGAMVFETSEPQQAWDGSIAGAVQPTGVFVWICAYQLEGDEAKVEKGTVALLR
jgi:gliding motility-associated-like protein